MVETEGFSDVDFDYLPPCAEGDLNSPVNCVNGPIVCSYDEKGRCTDHRSYLEGKYTCDIFFPTDFTTLARLVKTVTKNEGMVGKKGRCDTVDYEAE